jgi:hypothetical protein
MKINYWLFAMSGICFIINGMENSFSLLPKVDERTVADYVTQLRKSLFACQMNEVEDLYTALESTQWKDEAQQMLVASTDAMIFYALAHNNSAMLSTFKSFLPEDNQELNDRVLAAIYSILDRQNPMNQYPNRHPITPTITRKSDLFSPQLLFAAFMSAGIVVGGCVGMCIALYKRKKPLVSR